MVNRDELKAVIVRLREEEGVIASFDMAHTLAMKLDAIKARRHPFGQALRLALNECHIQGESRSRYATVMGAYFGSHGGKQAARLRREKIPPKPKKHTTV